LAVADEAGGDHVVEEAEQEQEEMKTHTVAVVAEEGEEPVEIVGDEEEVEGETLPTWKGPLAARRRLVAEPADHHRQSRRLPSGTMARREPSRTRCPRSIGSD
jgi:hypothetical protein